MRTPRCGRGRQRRRRRPARPAAPAVPAQKNVGYRRDEGGWAGLDGGRGTSCPRGGASCCPWPRQRASNRAGSAVSNEQCSPACGARWPYATHLLHLAPVPRHVCGSCASLPQLVMARHQHPLPRRLCCHELLLQPAQLPPRDAAVPAAHLRVFIRHGVCCHKLLDMRGGTGGTRGRQAAGVRDVALGEQAQHRQPGHSRPVRRKRMCSPGSCAQPHLRFTALLRIGRVAAVPAHLRGIKHNEPPAAAQAAEQLTERD